MDLYGVSEVSAAARDAGGAADQRPRDWSMPRNLVSRLSVRSAGLPQYYTYSATNFRLQELSLGYTHAAANGSATRWRLTVSFVGRNLWMIYCKAPFDPEAVASTGLSSIRASTTS